VRKTSKGLGCCAKRAFVILGVRKKSRIFYGQAADFMGSLHFLGKADVWAPVSP
jgi:hypothetical protein